MEQGHLTKVQTCAEIIRDELEGYNGGMSEHMSTDEPEMVCTLAECCQQLVGMDDNAGWEVCAQKPQMSWKSSCQLHQLSQIMVGAKRMPTQSWRHIGVQTV